MPEPNGRLTAGEIFALLSAAEDWRPKPNPRTPMAFALCRGWVFKSDLSRRSLARDRVAREVLALSGLTARLGVWHPAKTWFVLRDRRRYLACSATPRLKPAPRVWLLGGLLAWQKRRLVAKAAAAGYALDPRAVNFGFESRGWRLYYIDDEIYPVRR